MIAILEDRKGFKKEIYVPYPIPYYKMAQLESWALVSDFGNVFSTPIKGREITFDFYKEEFIFGVRVQLFKERI